MNTSPDRPVRTLGVIGAGTMGSGIAQKAATEGFPVILLDLDDDKVARGVGIIERTLAQGVERRIFEPETAAAIRERVRGTTDWTALAGVDLVIEAVFEDEEVKRRVFRRLEDVCRPDAILATNTSSLLVTRLAEGARRPERIVGLHYFYHPAKNHLVEVIAGERTDEAVARRAWAVQEQMGKTPIRSADAPGFIVNRYFVPWLNESVRMLEEEIADIPTIEAAAKTTFGIGMGPFELMNVTGLPIALHAATSLGEAFGPLYAPAERLRAQVAAKTGWDLAGTPDASKLDEVGRRLQAVTFLVSCSLVDEEVGTIEDVDIGARVGLRWPSGPFEMINRVGLDETAEMVREIGGRWDLPVPGVLSLQWRARRPFELECVRPPSTKR